MRGHHGYQGELEVGKEVVIQTLDRNIDLTGSITIGDYTTIARDSKIFTHKHIYTSKELRRVNNFEQTVSSSTATDVNLPKINCPHCRALINKDLNFCTKCGQKIKELATETIKTSDSLEARKDQASCPKCSNSNPPDSKFCVKCGASLSAPQ